MGVDQSFTSTGCVIKENDVIQYAGRFVSDPETTVYNRVNQILEYLTELQNHHQPEIITFEGLAFSKNGNATRDLAGLLITCVHYFHFTMNKSVMVIPPKTMKLVFTGSGNASKQEVFETLPKETQDYLYTDLKILKTKGLYDVCDGYGLAESTQKILNDPKLIKKVDYFTSV